MSLTSVVIVGAGHAGVQAAASLREQGFDGEIVLLSAEKDLPYQRPPLSKAFLKGEMDIHGLPLRADAHFREQRIDLRLGVSATRIDRASQKVELSDGGAIAYGHLILATGARQRRLDVPGVDLPGVFALRDIADATAIRGASRREAQGRHHRRWVYRARNRRDRREPRRPTRQSWRSRARWAAPSRRSCRIFS